jgi:hexulose-6-phosphate isomerase
VTIRDAARIDPHDMGPAFAIMQGRLSAPINGQIQSFPAAAWESEFERAARAKLDAIEWIFDARSNPILADAGAARILQLTRETGVGVRSICADYFMDAPLHRGTDSEIHARLDALRALIDRASNLGIEHIVLPCVDQSAITDDSDRDRLVSALSEISGHADDRAVEVHLETSLAPNEFASLLDRLPTSVRANYDSGNSASLGYDVVQEFAAYGRRVGSVHIKDRVRGAGSVPLGTGNANFVALFEALERTGYRGLFTLQVARGALGDEVELARNSRAFVLDHLKMVSRRP